MDFKHKQLEQELTALSRAFSELGARLAEVAKEVTAPGVIPSEKLVEQISVSRTSFERARSSVHGHAGAMLVSPLPKLEDLMSIAAIDGLLKASAVAEETRFSVESERDRALAILGRVLSIVHRESSDFKALQECHAKVGELRNGLANVLWPHRHPESEAIVSSRHPTTALLHFVENVDKLDDDSWMRLETTITDTYGKPLFVAASRGKLAVRPEARTEAANRPTAAAPPLAKAPAPEPPKPAATTEKPIEKKIVAEKTPEKPVAAPEAPVAPVTASPKPVTTTAAPPAAPAVLQKPAAPAPVAAVAIPAASAAAPEKKPTSQVVPAVPVPVTAAPVATLAAAPVASVPPPAAPVAATQAALPRPQAAAPVATPSAPAAVAPAITTPAPVAAPSAPAAASNGAPSGSPLTVTMNSLSALASATEPPEKKPAVAPVDSADKQRKEPRLAAVPPQAVSKPDGKPQELPETAQQGVAGDGSQRPQRWGFWRGNR